MNGLRPASSGAGPLARPRTTRGGSITSRLLGILIGAGLLAPGESVGAQVPASDDAVFVVRADDQVVGREEFSLREMADAGGRQGFTLTVINQYPHSAPIRTFARFGARRVTIRIATASGETTREYPNRPGNLVADEWVLSLYAAAADLGAGAITVRFPRTGGDVAATLEDHGRQQTPFGEDRRELRHVVIGYPDGPHHLWFDDVGRLMKVTIPSRNLVAERRLN